MDYASYRRLRDELLAERTFLRLDCMNPVQALAPWAGLPAAEEAREEPDAASAVETWSRATGIAIAPACRVLGAGVRELLAATLAAALGENHTLWLPEDVYPVYWDLAGRTALATTTLRSFATLPSPDWSFLDRLEPRAALVLPVPLSPLGRYPSERETSALTSWLRESGDRLLVVDAVYTHDFAHSRRCIEALRASDACVVLWSCAKAWLSPGSLGLGAAPPALASRIRDRGSPVLAAGLGAAIARITARPELPRLQQHAFARQWRRLAPQVSAAAPSWRPPEAGYFSVVARSFRALLEDHGILAVPASVFGSPRDDLSIITCLHDLARDEQPLGEPA